MFASRVLTSCSVSPTAALVFLALSKAASAPTAACRTNTEVTLPVFLLATPTVR